MTKNTSIKKIIKIIEKETEKLPETEKTLKEIYSMITTNFKSNPLYYEEIIRFESDKNRFEILYDLMKKSKDTFTLYLPTIESNIQWKIPEEPGHILLKETFASYLEDSKFLKEFCKREGGKIVVATPNYPKEKDLQFIVTNIKEREGYSVKGYSNKKIEHKIRQAFSDNIGLEIFDSGKYSFVEELRVKLKNSKTKYVPIEEKIPKIGGQIAGVIFKILHEYNVALNNSKWTNYAALKVHYSFNNTKISSPKLLDLETAFHRSDESLWKNDAGTTFEQIIQGDIISAINGLVKIYGKNAKKATSSFYQTYYSLKIEKNTQIIRILNAK
ncbi:MAG: hypothetical protein ACP5NV_01645 [Candidatus Woesearchaeota archaeon]